MLDYYRYKEIHELYLKGQHEEARHLLTEMQSRYIAACDENTVLRQRVQEMEDTLFLAKNLIFDGFCYWLITGNIKQGPFCRECYNREGALIRLETQSDEWRCSVCGVVHERLIKRDYTKPADQGLKQAPKTARIIPFSS